MKLTWHPVIRVPLENDMRPLLQHLVKLQLLHHVTEEDGQQQLWIADEARIIEIAKLTAKWVSGEVDLSSQTTLVEDSGDHQQSKFDYITGAVNLIKLVPVTLITILLGFIGTLAILVDNQQLSYAEPFLFQANINGYYVTFEDTLSSGQYWRLLTPIFLHFSWLHYIFNGLIIWEIGRRIEIAKGSLHLILMILIVGILSNFAQYLTQTYTIFGGLSGVVYGVIGYIAIYQRFIVHPVLQFNEAAIVFFIVWLLLGVFGIIDFFIAGSIANAAHIAGLVFGAMIGLVVMLLDRNKT